MDGGVRNRLQLKCSTAPEVTPHKWPRGGNAQTLKKDVHDVKNVHVSMGLFVRICSQCF